MEKEKMYSLPELIEKLEPIYSEHRKNIKLGIDMQSAPVEIAQSAYDDWYLGR